MQDDEFEWDDAKAARNLASHGVSFEAARLAFDDAFAVVREDRRQAYGEARFILLGMVQEHLLVVSYAMRGERVRIIPRASRSRANDDGIMRKTAKRTPRIDFSRADAMSARQRRAAAMADRDNRPMTDAEWAAAPRVPQVSVIRRALRLSQEDFAGAFHIPLGTLRDWEQGRNQPDAAARAYLRVIARAPDTVRQALIGSPRAPR
jgi:putative transcriptional regulator